MMPQNQRRLRWWSPLLYVWAFPGSAVGLLFIPVACLTGGGLQVVDGVLEVYGGRLTKILRRPFWMCGPIAAITLGHVVLGCDQHTLRMTRRHERVHVRQYERWGPFMIPVYLLSSFWIGLRGGDPYLHNPFEIEAYEIAGWEDDLE